MFEKAQYVTLLVLGVLVGLLLIAFLWMNSYFGIL